MSSDVSLTPSSRKGTTNEKRRPAFNPANPTKKHPKRSKGTKVIISKEQKQEEAVISPPQQPSTVMNELKRNARKPRTKNNNNKNSISTGTSISRNFVDDHELTTTVAPGSIALSTFCSKYRVKGVIATVVKDTPAPALDHMLPEPEEPPAAAGPIVQIINGEIVLQASSMEVPNARKTVAELEEEFDHVVEEEGHTTVVGASYTSFVDRKKPQHWNVTETKLFYNALRQIGTDFACMESYFENRSRKQLKRKYQIEISKNSSLVELALNPKAKVAIDLSIFNVDKDSIVISKETPIIHQPTTGLPTTTKTNEPREESDEDPTMDEVDETEMDDEPPPTPTLASTMTMDSIFGDDPLFEELKELVENTEQEPEEVIPLLATTLTHNRVNKRPKFKARSKKK